MSSASIRKFFACCVTHCEFGLAVHGEIQHRRVPRCRNTSMYKLTSPLAVHIGLDTKSHCQSVSACRARNASHESLLSFGSGSSPASFRVFFTVCRESLIPSLRSSPISFVYSNPVSFRIWMIRSRTSSGVRGRPGLRLDAGLDLVWLSSRTSRNPRGCDRVGQFFRPGSCGSDFLAEIWPLLSRRPPSRCSLLVPILSSRFPRPHTR